MPSKSKIRHRLERSRCASGRSQRFEPHGNTPKPRENVAVDCGWGRLLFGQTFDDLQRLVDCLREERPGKRYIALYLDEPHVILSLAPKSTTSEGSTSLPTKRRMPSPLPTAE